MELPASCFQFSVFIFQFSIPDERSWKPVHILHALHQNAAHSQLQRQGKGNVVRSMFRDIDAECYIMADGDDTYPAEFARELADKVLQRNADMVVGDRLSSTYFTENKRPFHNLGNSLVRWSINKIFKSNVKDIMTGYRAFSYQFVKTFPVVSKGFEIETEMTIHAVARNFKIKSIPVGYKDRINGSVSKLNTYKDGIMVISTIGKLVKEYRPRLKEIMKQYYPKYKKYKSVRKLHRFLLGFVRIMFRIY